MKNFGYKTRLNSCEKAELFSENSFLLLKRWNQIRTTLPQMCTATALIQVWASGTEINL